MDKKTILFSFVVALVGGLVVGHLISKAKGHLISKAKSEKKSSAMGDGEFKAGNYEKAW